MSDEIQRSLGRIEGKMDSILEAHKRHEGDIQELQAHKNRQIGYMVGFSTVLSAFWHFIPKLFTSVN